MPTFWDIYWTLFPPPTGSRPATPRPGPQRGAESTTHAYGQVVPVVYGSGAVRGFLAYAPETPIPGIGAVATVSEGGVVSFATNQSANEIRYAPAEYIFAQGPITAWRFIQRGTVKFADGSSAPLNLMLAVTPGTPPTWNDPELTVGDYSTVADWTYAAAKDVAHRVQFGHYAVLRTPYLIFVDGQVPDLRAGIDGRCATVTFSYGGTNYKGAPPADMLKDMAENTLLGMGLPAGTVITNAGTDGNAASSFDRYMTARGWVLARAFDAATAGDEAFGEVLAACDASCLWDGANLKIIPLCESAVGTYSPAATAYAFTDDEFVPASEGEDPIESERIPESDVATVHPVEFGPVYSPDGSTATVESAEVARSLWGTLGTRRGGKLSLPCIPIESHAKAISEINSRRSVYNRTRFRWTASWRHIAVQPGDFVTLTHSMMGLAGVVALVEKVEETDDGLRFEAFEWFPGVSLDISYTPQPPSGVGTNPLVPPDTSSSASAVADMANDGRLTPAEKPAFFNHVSQLWQTDREMEASTVVNGGWLPTAAAIPLITAFGDFWDYLALIGFDGGWCDIDRTWVNPVDQAAQRALLDAWMGVTTSLEAWDVTDPDVPVLIRDAETFRQAFVDVQAAVADYRLLQLENPPIGGVSAKLYGATGDGLSDDTAALQSALGSGLDVYLPAGNYRFTGLTMSTAGQVMHGDGPLTILTHTDPTQNAITVQADRVLIRDLRMNGTATAATSSKFGIFTAAAAPARWLGVERVIFSGADGTHGLTNGVKFDTGSDYGWVKDCRFLQLLGTASGYGYGVLAGECDGLLIADNYMVATAGWGRHGVYLSAGCTHCIVSRNYVEGFAYEGITLFSQGTQPSNIGNLLADNTVYNCATVNNVSTGAISIMGHGARNRVLSNIVRASQGCGIKIEGTGVTDLVDLVISDNVIDEARYIGIDIISAARGTLTGNFVRESGAASVGTYANIRFVSDGTTAASNWIVTGNNSFGTTYPVAAIQLNSTAPVPVGIWMTGNQFATCVTYAVHLMTGTSAIINGIAQAAGTAFPTFSTGTGAPTDNTPCVGSLYFRQDGGATTSLYVKTGATTWTAK